MQALPPGLPGQRSTVPAKSNGRLPDAMPTATPRSEAAEKPKPPYVPPVSPRLLDVRAAGAYLGGLSSWSIRQLVSRGHLRRVVLPGLDCWLVDVRDLDALIEQAKASAQAVQELAQ